MRVVLKDLPLSVRLVKPNPACCGKLVRLRRIQLLSTPIASLSVSSRVKGSGKLSDGRTPPKRACGKFPRLAFMRVKLEDCTMSFLTIPEWRGLA
jgi:hypothetical protein